MQEASETRQAGDPKLLCGTIQYTSLTLFIVFFWLLLGWFCFTLSAQIVPQFIPLKLGQLGASNKEIGFIITSIGSILNTFVCPIVSFKSDRYRSKWGRRIPFILFTLPMLCLGWILFGYAEDIASFLHGHLTFLDSFPTASIAVMLIGIIMFFFQFFYMFVGSVIYYIANDVIPTAYLARFISILQVVNTSASLVFSYFILKYAEGPFFKYILIGTSVVYALGVGTMCLMVKEPEYPPFSEQEQKESKGLSGIATFMRESFSHRFYWLRFAITSLTEISASVAIFLVFFYKEMGLSVEDGRVGQLNAAVALCGVIVTSTIAATCGFLVDKWHPMRIWTYGFILSTPFLLWYGKWLFIPQINPELFFVLMIVALCAGMIPGTFQGISMMPMYMLMFPKSRFGQFCSADAFVRAACVFVFGLASGWFLDIIRKIPAICPTETFAYRYQFVWQAFFMAILVVLAYLAYREWVKLGGVHNYHAPAVWSPDGFEAIQQPETIGPRRSILKAVLVIYDCAVIFGLLAALGIAGYAKYIGFTQAMIFFFTWGVIINVALIAFWGLIRFRIVMDIRRVDRGEKPKNGIPHHSMLLLIAIKHWILLGLSIYQAIMVIGGAAAIDEAGNFLPQAAQDAIIGWFWDMLMLGAVVFLIGVIAHMERGNSETFDKNATLLDGFKEIFMKKKKVEE